MQFLNSRIVGILVRYVECSFQTTTIRILSLAIKQSCIKIDIISVDGTVKGDGNHLRNLCGIYVSRNSCTIGRAETVWQLTLAEITVWCPVWIRVYSTSGLI